MLRKSYLILLTAFIIGASSFLGFGSIQTEAAVNVSKEMTLSWLMIL